MRRILYLSCCLALLCHAEIIHAQGGKDCGQAQAVPIVLPFTASGQSTCGQGNDYSNITTPCNGANYSLYTAGEDRLYYLTVATAGILEVSLSKITPANAYGSVFLFRGCPGSGGSQCSAAQLVAYGTGTASIAREVKAGESYFIMVDNYKYSATAPGCINYDIIARLVSFAANAQCTNADFETGNFNGWNVLSGKITTGSSGAQTPDFQMSGVGVIPGRHTILSGGSDPCGGFPVVAPGGKFSVRLGNNINGAEGEQIRQTFTVSAADPTYTYKYAVVFQDPNHLKEQQPFFKAFVYDSKGNVINCSEYVVSAAANIPGFKKSGGFATFGSCYQVWYKPWTTVIIDLKAYVGQEVTAVFTAGDCSLGGHFGYAYLDGSCFNFSNIGNRDTLCAGETKTLTAPDGYQHYQWSTGETTPSITVSNAGIYTVKLTSYSGCAAQISDTIEVAPYPKAEFTYTLHNCVDTVVRFTNTSTNTGPKLKQTRWFFGADAVPATATGDSAGAYFLQPGKKSVTMIAEGMGGCSDTMVKVLDIKPCRYSVVMEGGELCGSQCITLKPTVYLGNAPFTYAWSANAGAKPGDTTVTVCPLNTTIYTVTVTDAAGAVTTDTAIVYRNSALLLSTQVKTVGCSVPDDGAASVTVQGGKAPYLYRWNTGANTSGISGLVPGTYGVRVTDALGCSDTATVMVGKTANNLKLNLSADTLELCYGGSVQVDASGASKYAWTPSAGLNSNSGNQILASPLASTLYTVIGEDSTGCSDTAFVYIRVLDSLNVQSTLTPATCQLSDGAINLQVSGGNGLFQYAWSHGPTTRDAVNISAGTYRVVITDSRGCNAARDFILTNINRQVNVQLAPENPAICAEQSLTLRASGASVYQWNDGSRLLGLGDSIILSPSSTTTYQVYVLDSIGCLDTSSITVMVHPNPTVQLAVSDSNICAGESVNLTASGAGTIYWQGSDGQFRVEPASRNFQPDRDLQMLVFGRDQNGCQSDTVGARVFVHPLPSLELGPDQVVGRHGLFPLRPVVSSDVTSYQWVADTTLSCTDCPQPDARIRRPSRYILTVSTVWGCQAQDDIRIGVHCGGTFFHIPNAFTPNRDGQNDYFLPYSDAALTVKSLQIFDRWGNLVWKNANFRISEKNKGWDGTYNGQLVPVGSFAYAIEVVCDNGETYFYKGTVTVIR